MSQLNQNTKENYRSNKNSLETLPEAIEMTNWLHKDDRHANMSSLELYQNGIRTHVERDPSSGNIVVRLTAEMFGDKYRGATICVGNIKNHLYYYKYMN